MTRADVAERARGMDGKTIEWLIGGPLLIGLLLISWWAMAESHKRLDDPNDDRTVYLDRLRVILKLEPIGVYRVTIFRQSGYVHAEHIITGSAQEALAIASATFRRAKIEAVHVSTNSELELQIGRLYRDHRGRASGKKVGRAIITLLERMEPTVLPNSQRHVSASVPTSPAPQAATDPVVRLSYVGIRCDCGTQIEVPFHDLHRQRQCEACGEDATLTLGQISQINAAAASLKEEALTRHRAGETNIKIDRQSTLTRPESGLTAANIKLEAAKEAVTTLGLLKPEAIELIASLMLGFEESPRATATSYRKEGQQLAREHKKAAGIRANAFMSDRAFNDLTEKGKNSPLAAHETTLLRAMFTELRFGRLTSRNITQDIVSHLDGFKYDTLNPDCPFCSRMEGTVVQAEEVAILPAPDCVCETANYSISPHFDWFKGIE
jgi:hypothetical protein